MHKNMQVKAKYAEKYVKNKNAREKAITYKIYITVDKIGDILLPRAAQLWNGGQWDMP